jgi:hypothetical protein
MLARLVQVAIPRKTSGDMVGPDGAQTLMY